MESSLESIIIIDVVVEQTDASRNAQLCSGLTNTYHSASVSGNTPDTFGWGAGGGMNGEVKITVGSVEFLVEYDSTGQVVKAIGTCGTASLNDFRVAEETTLQYATDNFSFSAEFALVDNSSIQITVTPASSTTVTAKD